MNEKIIVRHLGNRRKGRTDWERLGKKTDLEIEAEIKSNPDAAPVLDENWFKKAVIVMPKKKKSVSIRIDEDVLNYFKDQETKYQTFINAILRAYMNAHPK